MSSSYINQTIAATAAIVPVSGSGVAVNPAPGGVGLALSASPSIIAVFSPGLATNNQKLIRLKLGFGIKFPAGAAASLASASANATADTTYTFTHNGTPFATLVFHAGTTNSTYTQAADQIFVIGDLFEIDGQAVADGTLADVGITFQGNRT
jgi:hypothetical protein